MAGQATTRRVLSTCPYCGCGCAMLLEVRDGRLAGVGPASLEHPVSAGSLCVKGWNAHEFVHSPDRLTAPLIRRDGGLMPCSWDEALGTVADGLKRVIGKYGPDSVMFLSSAKCTNEENYLLSKFARAVVGTNNIDHCARLCHASTVVGLGGTFGSGAMTNSIGELASADCIFIIGSNTSEQHPQVAARIMDSVRHGGVLIVADPRSIRLSRFAKFHMRHRPGTDIALVNSMMHVILAEGLEDGQFITGRTEGFDELRRIVRSYPPDRGEAITGVPATMIIQAARIFAQVESSAIVYSMGITQHATGVDNVRTLANLAMLTGNIGRPNCGVNPLRGQNNVQGSCDMGALPDVFSGYQKVADPEVRAKFASGWGVELLPERPGLTATEVMHAAGDGKIKAMFIVGENPMVSDPDISHVQKALEGLELLVVQDIFPTETSALAHVVLPAGSFAEKDGTFTNTERRVQLVRKAVEPVGSARADWQIIDELARRMGGRGFEHENPAEIFDEMARLTPIYSGMSHRRLAEGFGLQWPCPTAEHAGTAFLHKDRFTRGLGRFMPAEYRPPEETPDRQYDMLLTTGRIYFHWHTGSMTRRVSPLNRESPEAFVEISPVDAGSRGISNGQKVSVATRRGKIKLVAHVTQDIAPGVIFIPFHYYEAAANLLTNPALDPEAKIPEFKACAAKIEPA